MRKYGWIPDIPDHRDRYFRVSRFRKLPSVIDLRGKCSTVENQESLGSCSAQAFVAVMEYLDNRTDGKYADLSKLFVYYNTRDDKDEDTGAYLRDGIKALAKYGACDETLWPYDIALYAKRPTDEAYEDGLKRQITEYRRIDSLTGVRQSLADGNPVVFGFSVYDSFDSVAMWKDGGRVPIPKPIESLLGGHAVVAVGYDDSERHLIVRNSWGPEWGFKGHFYMPYEYASNPNLTDDWWSIIRVEDYIVGEEPWEPDLTDVKWYVPITSVWRVIREVWNRIFGSKQNRRKGD